MRRRETQYVATTVTMVHQSAKAVLLRSEDGTEAWVPKSQTQEVDWVGVAPGTEVDVEIAEWILEREGL